MTFDWWTLGLQTLNLLVLLWILSHFLFRPVSEILAKRQAAATAALDQAREVQAEAEAARIALRDRDAAQAKRRAELLSRAHAEAERGRKEILSEARKDAATLLRDAQSEIDRRRAAAEKALRTEAGELAIDIAQRLLARLPAADRSAAFIEGLAEAVSDLPGKSRAGLGLDGPVVIRSAAALSPEATRRLAARLAEVLGHAVSLSVTVDPELIAGLELEAPHAVVRNHFRADLDRIRQELQTHD